MSLQRIDITFQQNISFLVLSHLADVSSRTPGKKYFESKVLTPFLEKINNIFSNICTQKR